MQLSCTGCFRAQIKLEVKIRNSTSEIITNKNKYKTEMISHNENSISHKCLIQLYTWNSALRGADVIKPTQMV